MTSYNSEWRMRNGHYSLILELLDFRFKNRICVKNNNYNLTDL